MRKTETYKVWTIQGKVILVASAQREQIVGVTNFSSQSIRINFYCANIPGEGQAQWRTKQIMQCPKAKRQDSVQKC